MIVHKCLVCGSTKFRADRALSGRLVCTSCGTPYGVRKVGRNNLNYRDTLLINKKYLIFIFIVIVAVILVIF